MFQKAIFSVAWVGVFVVLASSSAADEQRVFEEPITVSGKALDANGQPIPNAQIYLASVRHQQKLIGETITNANGEYKFDNVGMPVFQPEQEHAQASGVFEVFGQAKGYGFAWRGQKWFYPDDLPDFGRPDDKLNPRRFLAGQPIIQDLDFDKPAPLRGQVVDGDDQPIPNASVVLFNAEPVPETGYDTSADFLTVQSNAFTALYDSALTPGEMRQTHTDRDGNFSFDQAPRNTGFRIFVKPPGFATRGLYASTSEQAKFRFSDLEIHRDGMTLVFHKTRKCIVSVVYDDSGKPAKNVHVNLRSEKARQSKVTDASGRAVFGLPPGNYEVHYLTEFETPYVPRYSTGNQATHTILDAAEDSLLGIRLERAATVEVEVVDAHIGRPIEGVDVWVEGGKFRHDYEWRGWKPPNLSCFTRPRTSADGKMTIYLPTGTYRVGAGNQHTPEKYSSDQTGTKITVTAGEVSSLKLQMRRRGVPVREQPTAKP